MMAAVATSLLPLSLPLCRNMTYHGRYENSVMEKWKNNNKPMKGTVIMRRGLKRDVGLVMHCQGFFGQFFFTHTISWAHDRLIVE
jgi:hypothetical protein